MCQVPTKCKSFQRAWINGNKVCAGCFGEMKTVKMMSLLIDEAFDPIINRVHQMKPEDISVAIIEAARTIQSRLVDEGFADEDGPLISGQEIGLAINTRLMLRIQNLEAALRLRIESSK